MIPSTAISIRADNPKDIFSSKDEQILTDEGGSYEFLIREPGIYRITFRGVFHHSLSIPVLIYDQSSMAMNILLLPTYYNDGAYFKNKEYMKWVRIYGNFNDFSYDDGRLFSLNNDGSISAFIPVTSDTIRYLVDGLTYGRGSTPLPMADEYNFNKDHGFESVLYKDLPEDSLKIRYTPGRDIPYERPLPKDVNPQKIVLSSFISFKNQEDKNWIQPLSLLQPYTRTFHIIGWEMSKGIPVQIQKEVQKKYGGTVFNTNLGEVFEEIKRDLNQDKIHLQQKAILTVSYASILGWMEHKTRFQKRRNEQQITEFNPDKEIINSILEIVPPSHPAWRYNNGAVDYLLTETDDPQKFTDYSRQVVVFHPDERAVRSIAVSLIRHFGSDYSSVEEMPVYQIILERYGKNEVARAAYQAFDFSHLED